MTWLISVLAAVCISLLVFAILSWVRTPHYRVSRSQVLRLLQWVVLGQASENDWHLFCDIPIRHDPWLESIRQRCEGIEEAHFAPESHAPYLFTRTGMSEVHLLLNEFTAEYKDIV